MKVGTDGVLIGAWTNCSKVSSILDIGAGTGVISLMLAQRSNAIIKAIEIDSSAALQCQENFQLSPWKSKLKIIQLALQDFKTTEKFDLIVSNPPYFPALKANTARSIARSEASLALNELVSNSVRLLEKNGRLVYILPYNRKEELLSILSNNNLFLNKICYIKGNINSSIKRILIEISRKKIIVKQSDLIIEEAKRNNYTFEYSELLKDYLIIF